MTEYVRCINCDGQMWGIMQKEARSLCEDCGGNSTEYNEKNPHPEGLYGKREDKQ